MTQDQIEELFAIDPSNPYERADCMPFNSHSELGRRAAAFVDMLRAMSTYKQGEQQTLWNIICLLC